MAGYPHVTLEVGDENPYPYPSHFYTPSFVTLKLSGRDEYEIWKTQMLCLLESHGKEKVGDHQTHHKLWRRSDALVKGWILGALSKQTLTYVVDRLKEKVYQERNAADFCAKEVWDELETMYAPAVVPPELLVVEDTLRDQQRAEDHKLLYKATLGGEWSDVQKVLREREVTVLNKITNNGNTALHVAVGTSKKPWFLQKLLGVIPENTQLLDVRNSDGSTLLHVAAIVGNTEAADILLGRNLDLLLAKDNEGHTPLAIALSNMHTETSKHLLKYINTDREKDALFSGTSGDEHLVNVISSKDFGFAKDLMQHYKTLHTDAVLMAIAQNFPCELSILEEYIGTDMVEERDIFCETCWICIVDRCIPCVSWFCIAPFCFVIDFCLILLLRIVRMLVSPFIKERVQIHEDAMELLTVVCRLTIETKHSSSFPQYYTNPILEAARQNSYEVVQRIVYFFPSAIMSANEDGHNVIQYAVINRSEKVYNLLYEMSEHRNIYRTIKDSSGNNLLHLAARLAPSNKLNLISGAALQIQRELLWFKEVEGFVCPLSIIQKNSSGETPKMIFTREHKDLVIEGEKWMKSTAESYTITAALIITIVFAAAITVPGGSNQDTGIPIFTYKTAFTIFAISDAISLFAAVTSLLMFLSILTARFAEQDFLFKLPTKLIIGLATLFISTTAMIVAFAATLYLVFGQSHSRVLIPIAVLTCLPITSFVTLQFPLVLDLMSAIYGRSIFGEKRDYSYWDREILI
ncbi:unnamed protein product [Lactuca virosa]|uniref:PGG domain-containing protein n=1 Tax=Lactuca virosa TaxID=75947 RepID=A0AAU9NER3_9ASTR|nr:unnamed protein product [Lactuca virosa]